MTMNRMNAGMAYMIALTIPSFPSRPEETPHRLAHASITRRTPGFEGKRPGTAQCRRPVANCQELTFGTPLDVSGVGHTHHPRGR